jgi:predicted HicB family RNase H-like nuclease
MMVRTFLEGARLMEATSHLTHVNTQQPSPAERHETPQLAIHTPEAADDGMTSIPATAEERCREVLRIATELFQQKPDWVTFFREVLGVSGVVRRMFPTKEQMLAFEQTHEYIEVQQMVARLRGKSSVPPSEEEEPTRVITVRLPKSLHESLRTEAHERQTSMNKLCISKLLQIIDNQFIPAE